MGRAMKDSGVEWIGEIPEQWETIKGKYLYSVKKGKLPNLYSSNINGDYLPYLSMEYQRSGGNPKEYASKKDGLMVNAGDITVLWDGSNAGEFFKSREGILSSTVALIKTNALVESDYMYFSLKASEEDLKTKNTGMGIPHVNGNELKNNFYPMPPIEKQKEIVNKLTEKTLHIDSIIEKTKASIDSFKRYKQALIMETVTKGLNPDVPMKYSGIEWIGMIPEHWEVSKLGRVFEVILGKMLATEPKKADWTLEKYIRAANVHFEGVDLEDINTMWFSPQEKERLEVRYEDLLIVEGGAGAGGSALFLSEEGNYYIQNSINLVRPKTVQGNTRYTYYLLYSLVKNGYIDFVCNKATFAHFTKEKVSAVPHPIIPIVEQHQIATYLDEKTAHIDSLIQNKEAMIEKLEAYKKSLIYEYVTGKKEVE